METTQFEAILETLCGNLTTASQTQKYGESSEFEDAVRDGLRSLLEQGGKVVDVPTNSQVFPDIVMENFGVEVKFTTGNGWKSIANSIFEGSRDPKVEHIYLVFGKMGGDEPEVRYARYEDCVTHVRTSHVPRFEVELPHPGRRKSSLFLTFGISYAEFAKLTISERMKYVREYARVNHPGEELWWLGAKPAEEQFAPAELRLFTGLTDDEKDAFRAEAALLFPEIIRSGKGGNNAAKKYDRLTRHLLREHSVICSNVRDMFSAGSAAGHLFASKQKGDSNLRLALKRLEPRMREAAKSLDDALFIEYWGESVDSDEPEERAARRIRRWLEKADALVSDWTPSQTLFTDRR